MDEKSHSVKTLERQLEIQETLVKCINTLHGTEDVGRAIQELLSIIAQYHAADRAYIFELDRENHVVDNTYEWCRDGVEAEIDRLQRVDISVIDRWLPYFEREGEFYITSLSGEVDSASEEYRILMEQGVHSLMAAPLYVKGVLMGFLGVDNPRENTDPLLLMRSVAAFVVNDIQKRMTEEQQIIGALAGIYISMYLLNITEDTYHEIKSTTQIKQLVGRRGTAVYKHMEKVMRHLCADEYVEEILTFIDVHTLEERMSGNAIISREFVGRESGWCRLSLIRVEDEGQFYKVICAVQEITAEKERELAYQQAIREALENQTDAMTGISNRGGGEQKIMEYLEHGTSGMFCLMDVDKFKSVNDTFGHAVGDKVLKELARAMKESFDAADVVLRIGGDEFAVYALGIADENTGGEMLDRFFASVDEIAIPEMREWKISVSLGAVLCDGKKADIFDELYQKADEAMYLCKKNKGKMYGFYHGDFART